MDKSQLAEALLTHYAATLVFCRSVGHGGGRPVLHVKTDAGDQWIVRALPPDADDYLRTTQQNAVRVLTFLAQDGYPAERVIRSTSGKAMAEHEGCTLLVTQFLGRPLVTGANGPFDVAATAGIALSDYAELGSMIGRLHAIPITHELSLPDAIDLPRRDLVWVASRLASLADDVPSVLLNEYRAIVHTIEETDLCEGLPPVLLHNDCQPWNVVQANDGSPALVDWAGSGMGPAVIDIAEFIGKCHLGMSSPNEALIQTIVGGYSRFHQLHPNEIKRVPDAMRFRPTVLLGGFFHQRIDGTLKENDPLYGWSYRDWQAYLALTKEVAEVTMRSFLTASNGRMAKE